MPPPPDKLLMILETDTREAFRLGGEDPATSGPVFFTSREKLDAFAEAEGIDEYTVYEVPGMVVTRLRGKPHWVDPSPDAAA